MLKLSKKERERLKGKTYKAKVQKLMRKYGKTTDIKQYIASQYQKWGITQIDYRKVARMSTKEQTKYYRREYAILQGKYDIKRKRQWKENYKQAMKEAGVEQQLIDEFVKVANVNNIDLLSRDLANIVTWYNQKASYANEDATQQVVTIIREIKLGRYKESRELYKTRIAEQVQDTRTTLSMYKNKSVKRGKKRK